MRKKILINLLVLTMLFSTILVLAGCGNNNENSNEENSKHNTEANTDYLSFIEFNEKENYYVYIDKNANIKKLKKDKYTLPTSSLSCDFVDNCIIVQDESRKNIVIDSDQNIILDNSYGVDMQSGKFFRTYKNGKYGAVDKDKNVIVPNKYEFLQITTFEDEKYKDLCVILAENSDDTCDMYTNVDGKILSNITCRSGISSGVSYYDVDGINTGIIQYYNENLDKVYVNSKDGTELGIQNKDATKTVDVRKNCIITEEKGSKIKNVQIFDNKLNLTNKIETEGTINTVPGYIIITETEKKTTTAKVYDMNGKVVYTSDKVLRGLYSDNDNVCFYDNEKVYNSKFETIYEFKTNDKIAIYYPNMYMTKSYFIYIVNDKKITVYNYDGTIALSEIDGNVDDYYVVKENEKYAICGNRFVKTRDGSELYSYPVKELQYGSDKYIIQYKDGFQIYDKNSDSIIWDYKEDNKTPTDVKGVYAIKLGNIYYDYYGNKVYEIKK